MKKDVFASLVFRKQKYSTWLPGQHVRGDVNTRKNPICEKKTKSNKIKSRSSDSATEAEVMKMEMVMVKSGCGTSFQNLLQRCL